ncbi:hypothetical protein DH2020_011932 [Rehmannia glutinosa]|uniref:CONSTANS-like protein n=1 Tax=Rehmannia glutinosa TaxID=99300 RepID=A0ABR0XES7_REHGL
MFSSDKKLANAVGAKSARACDNCIRKRARWYCAADDAFLCQSCDSSSSLGEPSGPKARKVRLKTASFKSSDDEKSISTSGLKISVPTWHQGFTEKPEPRGTKTRRRQAQPAPPRARNLQRGKFARGKRGAATLSEVAVDDGEENGGWIPVNAGLIAWLWHMWNNACIWRDGDDERTRGGNGRRRERGESVEYREKRRTRLFSKKIRYEVRKLNAEKRPRMKGRFVKRSNFVAPSNFSLLNK